MTATCCTAAPLQEAQQALEEELAQRQEAQQRQQQEAQAAADAQAAALAAKKRHWAKPQGPFDGTPKRPTAGSTLRSGRGWLELPLGWAGPLPAGHLFPPLGRVGRELCAACWQDQLTQSAAPLQVLRG
jgi:multidrug efflux pump subunit AcrA (membrane-fusion protein)